MIEKNNELFDLDLIKTHRSKASLTLTNFSQFATITELKMTLNSAQQLQG